MGKLRERVQSIRGDDDVVRIEGGHRRSPIDRQVRSLIEGLTDLRLPNNPIRKIQQPVLRSIGVRQDALKPLSGGAAPNHMKFLHDAAADLGAGIRRILERYGSSRIKMFGGGKLVQTARRIR